MCALEFLNQIVNQLWPNLNRAISKTIKDVVEPMFKTMLPGPLQSLHFTKIDVGTEPMKLSHAAVTRTDEHGIILNLNVNWQSKSDIELVKSSAGCADARTFPVPLRPPIWQRIVLLSIAFPLGLQIVSI